jgi:hypothetical protein
MTTLDQKLVMDKVLGAYRFRVLKQISGDLGFAYYVYAGPADKDYLVGPFSVPSKERVRVVISTIRKKGIEPVLAEYQKMFWERGFPFEEKDMKHTYLTGAEARKYARNIRAYGDVADKYRSMK